MFGRVTNEKSTHGRTKILTPNQHCSPRKKTRFPFFIYRRSNSPRDESRHRSTQTSATSYCRRQDRNRTNNFDVSGTKATWSKEIQRTPNSSVDYTSHCRRRQIKGDARERQNLTTVFSSHILQLTSSY